MMMILTTTTTTTTSSEVQNRNFICFFTMQNNDEIIINCIIVNWCGSAVKTQGMVREECLHVFPGDSSLSLVVGSRGLTRTTLLNKTLVVVVV